MKQPALIVIDMLNDFLATWTPASKQRLILAADCVGSYDREHHEISLRYMKDKIAAVMSNDEIREMLASPG